MKRLRSPPVHLLFEGLHAFVSWETLGASHLPEGVTKMINQFRRNFENNKEVSMKIPFSSSSSSRYCLPQQEDFQ